MGENRCVIEGSRGAIAHRGQTILSHSVHVSAIIKEWRYLFFFFLVKEVLHYKRY